jgi:Fe-S cluster assembly protein SufD
MAGLPNSSNALQQWHRLFEAQGGTRSEQAQQHLQQMLRLGLPTRKHENWKYTPLDGLLNAEFVTRLADLTRRSVTRWRERGCRAPGVCRR